MADNASFELKRIRDAITKLNISIKNKLNMFVTSPTYNKYLQDSIVTIRNNRFVIPVKSEYKNNIPGLIHDQSASGKAVFVEPFQIVQLNNEIATLRINESLEIDRILRAFTVRVGGDADNLKQNFDVLTDLDIIFAKALYAHTLRAERPVLNNNGEIVILKGLGSGLGALFISLIIGETLPPAQYIGEMNPAQLNCSPSGNSSRNGPFLFSFLLSCQWKNYRINLIRHCPNPPISRNNPKLLSPKSILSL